MKLEIRWKGTSKSEALAEHVRRRLYFALGRFEGRLRRVVVRFEDTNGPKGGIDKRCSVETVGELGGRIVETRDADFVAAVDRALSLSGRAVVRAARGRRVQRTSRGDFGS